MLVPTPHHPTPKKLTECTVTLKITILLAIIIEVQVVHGNLILIMMLTSILRILTSSLTYFHVLFSDKDLDKTCERREIANE